MLIKTGKKRRTVLQAIALLLVMSLAIFTITCDDKDNSGVPPGGETPGGETPGNEIVPVINYGETLSWGTEFTPATLGLNPGNDTTEIRLNWYSQGTPAEKVAKVRFIKGTKTEGTKLIEAEGAVAAANAGVWTNTSHKAVVTGLEPGSSYQYSVSTDGTNWSPMYNFKIPAKTGAFKFAVVADPQLNVTAPANTIKQVDIDSRYKADSTTAACWEETMQKIVAAGASFIAFGGDQVDITNAGNEAEYEFFYAPSGLRNLPFSPVSGNHDAHNPFMYHYNLPNVQEFADSASFTDIQKMGNYFYLYNNILFVVLNTAPYPNNVTTAQPYIGFFKQTLQAAVAAHSGKYDWLIVQHHKSTASVADHLADTDIQYYVEAGFETLMSEFNVDFVLAGHDHVYARSFPLKGMDKGKISVPMKTGFNPVSGSTWNSPQDPIYFTFTTGSGIKYYAVRPDTTYNYFGPNAAGTLYVKNNVSYPYLGTVDSTGTTATAVGSTAYLAVGSATTYLPVSNAAYVQPYIPSYCIVEVNGRTIKFSTYPIGTSVHDGSVGVTNARNSSHGFTSTAHNFNSNTPYDVITITK